MRFAPKPNRANTRTAFASARFTLRYTRTLPTPVSAAISAQDERTYRFISDISSALKLSSIRLYSTRRLTIRRLISLSSTIRAATSAALSFILSA